MSRPRTESTPGPKPRSERAGFAEHRPRAEHAGEHPVHVLILKAAAAPSFSTEPARSIILRELEQARAKGLRIVDLSIQDDHLHVLVEGTDADDISDTLRRFFSRIAMITNSTYQRHGSVFRDRHQRQELTSARELSTVRASFFTDHPASCVAPNEPARRKPRKR